MMWCVFILQRLRSSSERLRQAYVSLYAAFPEHEIYVRSRGRVRFLRLTTRFQLRALSLACLLSLLWLGFSGRLMVTQYHVKAERAAISAKARAVEAATQQVEAFADDMTQKTRQLEMRQQLMEQSVQQHFGKQAPSSLQSDASKKDKIVATENRAAPAPVFEKPKSATDTLAYIESLKQQMRLIEKRQLQNARTIHQLAVARMAHTRNVAQRSGINPAHLMSAPQAVGGPYLPLKWLWSSEENHPDPILEMGRSLAALDQTERGFMKLPSHIPVK